MPEPPQPVLPSGLDSGDVVLFNRRCLSMSPAGAGLCVIAKLFSNSKWDHIGVIIRHPATGELLFLEADFGGVKLRSLEQRVLRSRSNEIAVRRLSVLRTNSMREKFYAFAQEMIGTPYDIGTGSVLARVTDPLAKQEKERLNALLVDKITQVDEISRELESPVLTTFQRRLLQSECDRVTESCNQIKQRLIKEMDVSSPIEKSMKDKNLNTDNNNNNNNNNMSTSKSDLSHVFCSELIAAAYQRVGLLGAYPPAFYYNPKDFSSQQTHPPGVHLLKSARLGNEQFLRRRYKKHDDQQTKQKKRALNNVNEDDIPSRETRKLIREVIKRTPIYNLIPDEYKRNHLFKSFRARIVEPGDLVFEQGQYGDKFYIVDTGIVERFILKGGEKNDPTLINTMGPKSSFGLSAFTYNSPRMSTVRAKKRTLLWVLDRPTFELFRDASSDIKSIMSNVDNRQLRRFMKQHFLFQRLDKISYEQVNLFFNVNFRAGETVFKQGDQADNLYIVKNGELERHIRRATKRNTNIQGDGPFYSYDDNTNNGNDDDEDTLVKTLKQGQSFGELSLMYNAPRSATIRARTDCECWALSLESFNKLNLSGGTQHLRAVFNKNASIKRNGEVYMTKKDLMRFAGVDAFKDVERERLSALLVSLVTSNRQRQLNDNDNKYVNLKDEDDNDDVLMDFWEFVRFDIVLNQPHAEMAFAFRLADQNNSGFISLDEMENLLQSYAPIDDIAKNMLSDKNSNLKNVFGRDGSRLLSAREFYELSDNILPPKFVSDVNNLTNHMLNMDVVANDLIREQDNEELAFIEPEGGVSILGSNFMNSSLSRENGNNNNNNNNNSNNSNIIVKNFTPKLLINLDWGHLLSVGLVGAVVRTSVAPFERLKILMQTGGLKYYPSSWTKCFKSMIVHDHNLFRALFRGNGANVIRIVPSAAIQLMVVDRLREMKIIRKLMDRDLNKFTPSEPVISGGVRTRAVEAVLIGGIAGMVAATATYPIDFIRGRLTIQRKGFEPYKGLIHGLSETIKKENFFSLYRGLGPTLAGVFPYVGLSFGIYETLRPILPKKNDQSGIPTTGSSIICGMVATATGQIASFPLDTCRRRMQIAGFDHFNSSIPNNNAKSFLQTWKDIQSQLGWRGFFRGLMPNLLKIAPASAVSFVAYEQVRGGMLAIENAAHTIWSTSSRRSHAD